MKTKETEEKEFQKLIFEIVKCLDTLTEQDDNFEVQVWCVFWVKTDFVDYKQNVISHCKQILIENS